MLLLLREQQMELVQEVGQLQQQSQQQEAAAEAAVSAQVQAALQEHLQQHHAGDQQQQQNEELEAPVRRLQRLMQQHKQELVLKVGGAFNIQQTTRCLCLLLQALAQPCSCP
jgi:uncharacterized FlaG/YvyC family protein